MTRADVIRWRDSFAGPREAVYNRALAVLSALLKYSEALGLRRKGSNPCRGMPRYKRAAKERYLIAQGDKPQDAGLDAPAELSGDTGGSRR